VEAGFVSRVETCFDSRVKISFDSRVKASFDWRASIDSGDKAGFDSRVETGFDSRVETRVKLLASREVHGGVRTTTFGISIISRISQSVRHFAGNASEATGYFVKSASSTAVENAKTSHFIIVDAVE